MNHLLSLSLSLRDLCAPRVNTPACSSSSCKTFIMATCYVWVEGPEYVYVGDQELSLVGVRECTVRATFCGEPCLWEPCFWARASRTFSQPSMATSHSLRDLCICVNTGPSFLPLFPRSAQMSEVMPRRVDQCGLRQLDRPCFHAACHCHA